MMTGHLIAVPWGIASGSPALALDFSGVLPSPQVARTHVLTALRRRPGMSIAWIRSAPWADEAFADILDAALDEFPSVYATQIYSASAWGFRDVHWFTDCSALLAVPATPDAIDAVVAKLPGFPSPAELLVNNPLFDNLTVELIDRLAAVCGSPATCCELAVPPALVPQAMHITSKAHGGWHVREMTARWPELQLFEVADA